MPCLKEEAKSHVIWDIDVIRKHYDQTGSDYRGNIYTIGPPYTKEEVDAWGVKMPPRFYEWLTEVSRDIYVDGNIEYGVSIDRNDFHCEDDDRLYIRIGSTDECGDSQYVLDISSGLVFYSNYFCDMFVEDTFENYILEPLREKVWYETDCSCEDCKPTRCLADGKYTKKRWNTATIRDNFNGQTKLDPPYSKEEVDAWGIQMNPRLYEYLTEVSSVIYNPEYSIRLTRDSFASDSTRVLIGKYNKSYYFTLDISSGIVHRPDWQTEVPHYGTFEEYILRSFKINYRYDFWRECKCCVCKPKLCRNNYPLTYRKDRVVVFHYETERAKQAYSRPFSAADLNRLTLYPLTDP
jgi:hypothetical protein